MRYRAEDWRLVCQEVDDGTIKLYYPLNQKTLITKGGATYDVIAKKNNVGVVKSGVATRALGGESVGRLSKNS